MDGEIAQLSGKMKDSVVVCNVSTNDTYTIAPGNAILCAFDAPSIAGYTPIIGIYASNTIDPMIIPFISSNHVSNNKFDLGVVNIGNSTIGNVRLSAHVLYIRS